MNLVKSASVVVILSFQLCYTDPVEKSGHKNQFFPLNKFLGITFGLVAISALSIYAGEFCVHCDHPSRKENLIYGSIIIPSGVLSAGFLIKGDKSDKMENMSIKIGFKRLEVLYGL